jgi:dimethylargininase
MRIAVTRDVNPNIGSGELTYLPRVGIDVPLAMKQHREYTDVLRSLDCKVINIEAGKGMADCVFIEDTAIVLDETAVLCRPGAASRRPETMAVADVLADFRDVSVIEAPGTVDGGDILCVGRQVYVGLSTRSNEEGARQLREVLSPYGYTVHTLRPHGCLHLKSAVTRIGPQTVLVNPAWIDQDVFRSFSVVTVDPAEPHGANAVLVGDQLVYPSSFPRTLDKLGSAGMSVTPVDVSELQKAEGAVTCCSLIFEA